MRGLLLAALLAAAGPAAAQDAHTHEHPDVAIRIDQAFLAAPGILDVERQAVGDTFKDLQIDLKEDGVHISAGYRVPVISSIHVDAVLGLVWISPNVFEIRVHKMKVLLFNITKTVVDTLQKRLNQRMTGICSFEYAGQRDGGEQALRGTIDMAKLMPSIPNLSLSGITTRDKVLILKAKLP